MSMTFDEALENAKITIETDILPKCKHFKIGKTGQQLEVRFNQSAYKDAYRNIRELGKSTSASSVSKLEAKLIEKYISCNKCDNIKGGKESIRDLMASEDGRYRVYIVWE